MQPSLHLDKPGVEKRPELEQVDFYLRYEDPRALGRQTSGARTPRGQGLLPIASPSVCLRY